MKIISITPYSGIQRNFSGNKLYRDMKKDLIGEIKLECAAERLSNDERYVGSLPKEWISKFKKGTGTTRENTEKIFKAFKEFTEDAANTPANSDFGCIYDGTGLYQNLKRVDSERYSYYLEPVDIWSKNIDKLQSAMRDVFDDECKIEFSDIGSFGVVFKITVGNKACALKTYRTSLDCDKYKGHGALLEIRNAVHLSSALKPSQCTRFYCAKIPTKADTDSFMLTSYKENEETKGAAQRTAWLARDGLYWGKYTFNDAHFANFVDGTLIDFGAVDYTFSNPETAKMAKEFFPIIQRGDVENVLKFKNAHNGEEAFCECMEYLQEEYMGKEEDLQSPEDFAYHCIERGITRKILNSFKALGADYSEVEQCAKYLPKNMDTEIKSKLDELFG